MLEIETGGCVDYMLSWVSSVNIVSDYRLDDRGSIPGSQRIFPVASVSKPALKPTQPPVLWVPEVVSRG
jgi:hypothetical protein